MSNTSSWSKEDILYIAWARETTARLQSDGFYVVLSLALVFNPLSILVYSRKKFSNNTIGFYNNFLSVVNTLIVLTRFTQRILDRYDLDVTLISIFTCKLFDYYLRTILNLSSWLNVLATLDRLIKCTKPNKFVFLKSRKIISLVIFGLVLVFLLTNSANLFFEIKISTKNQTYLNKTNLIEIKQCTASKTVTLIRDTMGQLIRIYLPFSLMFIINIILIRILIKSKLNLRMDKSLRKEIHFSLSIVALNIMFLITSLPLSYFIIWLNVYPNGLDTVVKQVTYEMNYTIAAYFLTFDYCLQFLVNLVFNRIFRREFVKILIWIMSKMCDNKLNLRESSVPSSDTQNTKKSFRNNKIGPGSSQNLVARKF